MKLKNLLLKTYSNFLKLLSILCLFIVLSIQPLQSATLMEEKLNLEKAIQDRVERLVEKIIGSKDMVVMVNVDLLGEANKSQKDKIIGLNMTEEEYLPGITYSYLQLDGGGQSSKSATINKITILITLDVSINEVLVNRIKKEVFDLIGLNPIRGDLINVQRIVFAKPQKTIYSYLINYQKSIFYIITIIILSLFLFGTLRGFMRNIKKALDERIEIENKKTAAQQIGIVSSGPNLPLDLNTNIEHHNKETINIEKTNQLFSFIKENNIKKLFYLLKRYEPEKIATVINYLPTNLASYIINNLPSQIQTKIIKELCEVKLLEPINVTNIESEIKDKIDYIIGGEEYFQNLLEQVDTETQENILHSIEQENPILAEKLKNSIFLFSDILYLDKYAIQRLIRESQRRNISFAIALKNASDDIKSKVFESLTEGARAMLNEQINLLGEIQEKRIQQEQKLIAKLAREMEKNGEIVIDRSKRHTKGMNKAVIA